ncbi:LytTR family DNA-binding domain-containing protein [Pedobacter sp. L105]|uniref:LytR/AlgR family response regulator transcription factor n=1 Tax=Pedobacter sp. L105 TaxID=1641871 RepID=UPI00131D2417|nr:LytTR family DNA-binding domain-containing protein [Pedobacter sp. L105]
MALKCLILDDEPLARETLEEYISKIPYLELVKSCKHVFEAIEILQHEKIDVLFSDIHMPEVNGIELIRMLQYRPYVVFITAYPNYAVEGFDLDIVDYIVKPFSFERFMKAVNKCLNQSQKKTNKLGNEQSEYLFLKDGAKLHRVLFDEICYIEGMKDYIKVVLKDRVIITHLTMKRVEDQLPEDRFFRIQKSYIININRLKFISGNMAELHDISEKLPIGKQYKDLIFEKFGLNND